ncbi:hypothetical protein MRB53_006008 [Persea americana]|uniref:Uncharacterized protein n=1 Tax=Persea americana TaxID=3435 RepID=A0ACC2MF01_PERAE|nr:hypothetical protein MRB53_006008 [Persea americana]
MIEVKKFMHFDGKLKNLPCALSVGKLVAGEARQVMVMAKLTSGRGKKYADVRSFYPPSKGESSRGGHVGSKIGGTNKSASNKRLAERIEQEGKGCVTVVNKWDTIPNKNNQTATYYEQDVRDKLRVLDWAPIVYSSGCQLQPLVIALTKKKKKRNTEKEEAEEQRISKKEETEKFTVHHDPPAASTSSSSSSEHLRSNCVFSPSPFISLTKHRKGILSAASMVEKERARRLGTSVLNQVVQEALAFKAPPMTRGGKRGRFYYCTQDKWTLAWLQ